LTLDHGSPQSGLTTEITNFALVTSGSVLSITLTNIKPSNHNDDSTKDNFVSVLESLDATGAKLNVWDSDDDNGKVSVSQDYVPSTTAKGSSSNWAHSLTPDNAGVLVGADASIKFKLSETLCIGSVLKIESPLTVKLAAGDIKDSCWSNKLYTSCQATTNSFTLKLGAEVPSGQEIKLYFEQALTLPGDTTATATGFKVKADWEDTSEFVSDTETTRKFTAEAKLPTSAAFTGKGFSMSIKNAGEYSDYTFKFKSSRGYVLKDCFYIDFPAEFDAFVGSAGIWYQVQEPDTYYLNCSSTSLGNVECTVDKHRVTVTGTTAVDSANEIDITIQDVMNPTKMGASNEKIMIAQADESKNY
jgi:hypothetical protein